MPRNPVIKAVTSINACILLVAACGSCQLAAQDLAFEPNRGQFPPSVSFAARGSNYAISLEGTEASLRLRAGSASMKFVGGKPDAQSQALDLQSGNSNYLIGDDPSKWRTGVPHFSRVQYRDVYPGIDLIYYGNQRQLEYDLCRFATRRSRQDQGRIRGYPSSRYRPEWRSDT